MSKVPASLVGLIMLLVGIFAHSYIVYEVVLAQWLVVPLGVSALVWYIVGLILLCFDH